MKLTLKHKLIVVILSKNYTRLQLVQITLTRVIFSVGREAQHGSNRYQRGERGREREQEMYATKC